MAKVEIYTKPTCPYCIKAKALLAKKGIKYTEYDIIAQPTLRDVMIQRSQGRSTVPQIFINDKHIGGCDDLHAKEAAGQLNELLI